MMTKRNAHFEEIADQYDFSLPPHVVEHYVQKRVRFLLAQSHTNPVRALDVGIGTGKLAERLQAQGWQIAGVDLVYSMLRVAQRRGGVAVQGDSGRLPFPDESFDVAFCIAMLHHVAEPQAVRATTREMVRVVRRGGLAVYWDHNPYNPYWAILMTYVPQDTGEERLIPPTEIKAALSDLPVSVTVYQAGFVPDFVSSRWLRPFQKLEQTVERLPGLRRILCAHNVVVARKHQV